jgi:biofilm PGA synthesis protein PgaA
MSDQNLRRSVALSANYTLMQRPLSKGIVGLEWAASSNSLRNTAYFNPQSDNTAQVSYTAEWLSYLAQSRTLRQQLVLAVGRYAQEGYAAGTIGSINYEHDWKLSDVAQLRYGLGYVHRVYDGLVTDGPEANLSFNWRF